MSVQGLPGTLISVYLYYYGKDQGGVPSTGKPAATQAFIPPPR
jgi:hypothetical protein